MSKTVILYHDDLDGQCSAAIIKRIYKKEHEVLCIPVVHGKLIPFQKICEGDEVYIVDYTPETKKDFETIIQMTGSVDHITWIDHHKANWEIFPEYQCLHGNRCDTIPSGAKLTFQYIDPTGKCPEIVEYVSAGDTWDFTKIPKDRVMAFKMGIKIEDTSPENNACWSTLFNDNHSIAISKLIHQGEVLVEFEKRSAEKYLSRFGFETDWEGLKGIVCDIGFKGADFFDSQPDYDLFIMFTFDGEHYHVELRTVKDDIPHLGELAKKYGGGGHPKAAGFECKKLPFDKIS